MTAVGEIARGAATPTVLPVWERQLLDATTIPPHASHVPLPMGTRIPHTNLVQRSFFFTSKHISALKNKLPPHLRTSTAFDVLAAFFWRSCTAALLIDPDDEVRFVCAATIRSRSKSYLPLGFYGNAIVFPLAQTKAGDLRRKSLSYAVELVKKTKSSVTHGSLRSMIGRGSPFAGIGMHHKYFVSDLTRAKFRQVDFGWGRAAYGGLPYGSDSTTPAVASFYVSYTNRKGEEGVVVPLSLPRLAMERVVKEVERVSDAPLEKPHKILSATIRSAL